MSVATGLFTKAYASNFSFGIQGTVKDGYFYNQTAYSVWSFSVGMGSAPVEKMSFIVTFGKAFSCYNSFSLCKVKFLCLKILFIFFF